MTASIHLGYVVGTGEPVEIPLRHTAVTGQTQESGKTTTLEGLISRSGLQAVAYVTKRGESSFHVMNPISPYFQERADWKFVQSLLEASTETKLKFEQSWIMRASEGARTLKDVRGNIQKFLHGVRDTRPVKLRKGAEPKDRWLQKPARGLSGDVYYVLAKYLDDIMPELDRLPYSVKLDLAEGLNVMDLRDYEFPLQALVIRSVLDWTRANGTGIINVTPEAWKFAPKQRGSPVRQSAEEYIREGAALRNFLWIDSQDLAGVADVLMRQVGVWLFGVQRAKHEIERALDHMPEGLPARRPRPADIATLNKGQFYVCFGREMYKVYVQPAWMTAAHAEAIARGEEEVESAREILKEYAHGHSQKLPAATARKNGKTTETQLTESAVVPMSELPRTGIRIDGSGAASDGSAQHRDDSADTEGEEEAMWKEKYEALRKEFDDFRAKLESGNTAAAVAQPTLHGLSTGDCEAIYRYVKQRAANDPAILQVLAQEPELLVKVERPVLTMDGKTLAGRMAQLLSEGFFKQPQATKVVTAEAVRRGWCHPKTPLMRIADPLEELAKMGFLTRETDGYQMVAGMKVRREEA